MTTNIPLLLFLIAASYGFHMEKCGVNNAGPMIQQLNDAPLSSSSGVIFDGDVNTLYCVDKYKPALCSVYGKTAEMICVPIPGVKCIFAALPLDGQPNKMIALADNCLIYLILSKNSKGGITKIFTQIIKKLSKDSFNITATTVDKKGRMIIDIANLKGEHSKTEGKVLQVQKNNSVTTLNSGTLPSDSAFSCNGKEYYEVDSSSNLVMKYKYNPSTGKIGKSEIVFNLTDETHIEGRVCSIAVTKNDELWIGICQSGLLINYNPKQKSYNHIQTLPAKNPISVTIGGKNNDVIFVGTEPECEEDIAGGSLFALSGTGTEGCDIPKVKQ